MAKIHLQDLDMDDDELPNFEPIRRSQDPVSNRQSTQRRAEDGINRYRKARKEKERSRNE